MFVILVEYCMKLTLLSASKGSNYYRHVETAYNFIIKSETAKSANTTLTWLQIDIDKITNGFFKENADFMWKGHQTAVRNEFNTSLTAGCKGHTPYTW
jgi:hypothetical protein